MLVIKAFDYLTECAFSNDFNKLVPICNMITFLNAIVSFFVVETIVYKSFQFAWLDFSLIITHEVYLFILFDFSFFKISQEFLAYASLFSFRWLHRKFQVHIIMFINS